MTRRGVFRELDFSFRTALGDHQLPTATNHQPPTSINHHSQPPTADNHHQPPPTASRQLPTANRRHPWLNISATRGLFAKLRFRNFFFLS